MSSDREIDAAFVTIVEWRIGGLLEQAEPFFTNAATSSLATRRAVPTILPWREFARADGLLLRGYLQ